MAKKKMLLSTLQEDLQEDVRSLLRFHGTHTVLREITVQEVEDGQFGCDPMTGIDRMTEFVAYLQEAERATNKAMLKRLATAALEAEVSLRNSVCAVAEELGHIRGGTRP